MRTLIRRIEILEQFVAKQREAVAQSIQDAVKDTVRAFRYQAKPGEIELLISAFGAERSGRPLAAAETEVRAQLLELARHKFQDRGIPLQTTVSPETVIYEAVSYALVDLGDKHGVDCLVFRRARSALKAGRELSQEQRAAIDTYTRIFAQLAQLAGFSSFGEMLEACQPPERH